MIMALKPAPRSVMSVVCTHMASFGLVELLLMSVLQHAVHHATALPHVEQCLSVLVSHLLQPQGGLEILRHQIEETWIIALRDGGKLTAISSNLPNSSVP